MEGKVVGEEEEEEEEREVGVTASVTRRRCCCRWESLLVFRVEEWRVMAAEDAEEAEVLVCWVESMVEQ